MKLNIQLFAYTKKEWKDLPSKDTPIFAADLNNIENGIATASNDVYTKTEIDEKENNLKAENEYLNSVIEQAFTPVEKEGTSINYDNTINARFKDIKLCGDTTQNGTPTPDSPQDIHTVSGDNSIKVEGKNLLNYLDIPNAPSWSLWPDGKYLEFTLTPNTQYTLSSNVPQGSSTLLYFNGSITADNGVWANNSKTTTSDSNGKIYVALFPNRQYYSDIIDGTYYIQLEQGSTATEYEEHKEQTYPINLGSMELCKIGDYQDKIYKNNGKWYLEKQIGKVVLSGIEDIINDNVYNNIYQFVFQVSNPLNNPNLITMSSNYFKSVVWDNSWAIDNSCVITPASDRLRIMTSKYTNVNDFKAFLKEKYNNNKPIICYYILATPIATEITDTTLLEQLEELAGATTYAGETNIVATSDGLTIIPKTTALTK